MRNTAGMARMNRVHFDAARFERKERARRLRGLQRLLNPDVTPPLDAAFEANENHFRYGEDMLDVSRAEEYEE